MQPFRAPGDHADRTGEVSLMRVFRIAIPASEIGSSRALYESVLALEADDTVPSRLYFHCGDVILALIDWTVESRGPFQATPDNV
jgi:hypothetical protein